MKSKWSWGLLGMVAALGVDVAPAWACSPEYYGVCEEDFFVPGQVDDEPVEVPANLPGFDWHVGHPNAGHEPRGGILRRYVGDEIQDIQTVDPQEDGEYTVVFESDLIEGTTYSFEPDTLSVALDNGDEELCSQSLFFKAGPAAEVPATLGAATAGKAVLAQYPYGDELDSCGTGADADAVEKTLTVNLDDAAMPWRNVLVIKAVVDGDVWSVAPRTDDTASVKVFSMCDGPSFNPGLYWGDHTVVFQTTIPGMDGVIESSELEFTLDCTDVGRKNYVHRTGAIFAGENNGCAVHFGPTTSRGSAVMALVALLALVLRRRASSVR